MDKLVQLTDLTNLPLSSNQKRIWIISQQDKLNPAYNMVLTYHFKGLINLDIFHKSISLLFNRQHTVFSLFKQKDGEPYIDIITRPLTLESIDFSGIPDNLRKERILSFLGEDSRRCFDIENGPLYRLYLIKDNETSYYFHATIHHLLFDGWSIRVFVLDLSRIYNSMIQNSDYTPENLDYHSYDYAMEEDKSFSAEKEKDLIEFWKDNLKDCTPELKFPYDYHRKNFSTGFGFRHSIEISKECTQKLKELSKKQDVSLFNTMLSSLGILLQKYSGENDICIGIPVSNRRTNPLLDKIFGLFINTAVVRLKIEDGNRIKDYISNTKDVVRNAISHSNIAFEKIVEAVNPERISGINPLFQVSLSWLNNLTIPIDFGSIKGERVPMAEDVTPSDILFYLWEDGDLIRGEIKFNVDILKRETIVRLGDNYIDLVQSIVENPDQTISEISIVSENDKKKLAEFNNTEVVIPDFLIQNFFEKQSELTPLKTAVISGNSSLTYKELNDRANQLARHLISLGVTEGDVVGISIERSVEMVISALGILKAGCCYLPLDPSFPDDRINYMFEDSGAKILISQSSMKEKFGQFANTVIISIDKDENTISRNSTEKPELNLDSHSFAYIIYTSGSTGKPKGVKVHHESVVNLIESMSREPGIKENDILLAVVTLSFDMSVFELFVPLSRGATVVVANSQEIIDGQALINLIDKYNITILQATPSLWNILLSSGWKGKNDLRGLCGGEALTKNLVRQILPKVKEFWNCYGPTETTVYSTYILVTDPDSPILIGKPINNTGIYILDKNSNQLPIGVVGEICIGGLGVTKGYHNRPELTAEKFIPFENGQIIYKTGDLGRFLINGNIELFGRIDNQIKLRGFRIEPGEIENLLLRLSGVKEVVVKAHKFDENDERLVAFLNVNTEFKLTNEEITGTLSQHLPAYMIPSFYQTSDSFPRMPNGKINKKALLLEMHESDKKHEIDFDSLTDTQKKLVSIWENILRIKEPSPWHNFFDIGGNSLLAIRILNKIKEELGFALSFMIFIDYPTIIRLGNFIDSQSKALDKSIELIHLTETTNLPLTFNQKRLWLISKLQPEVPSYIISFTYQLYGSLNRDIFQKSLDLLFQRHHIVFSVIKDIDGEPYCDILPSKVNISIIDYLGLPENEKTKKIDDLIQKDSRKVFDLQNGPLYRLFLIITGIDEYYFRLSIHHIVFDGWSWSVLAKDFNEIYNSLLRGKEIGLEKIEFQQYDYAHWEKSPSGSVNEDELKEFWKENLKDSSPILSFPYDFQRREQPSGRASYEPIVLSQELSEKFRMISKSEGSSLFATMLSVFGIEMQKYSGEDDINIGLPVAYRPHSKLENIFGMFVNTVVVRMKHAKELTFREIIHRTNESARNAISHQDLAFEKVVGIVNPERSSNANPLFQVAFAWQNNLDEPINLDGIKSERITRKERAAIFDITLYLWEKDNYIEGGIEYNLDILRNDTIIRLKNNFLNLGNSLAENPDAAIGSLAMISDEEKEMINSVNDTIAKYSQDKTIIQLFEERAVLDPEKIAIIFDDCELTYSELNFKADQIAGVLKTYNIGIGDFVGLLLRRSPDLIVCLLAIFKTGAAYVPLNLTDPVNRVFSIVDAADIKYVITNISNEIEFKDNAERLNIEQLISQSGNMLVKSKNEGLKSTDPAYIIFTSGTTGTPKGVLVNHKSVINIIEWVNKTFEVSHNDKLLWITNLSFDLSVYDIFGILTAGGIIRILSDEDRQDPKKQYDILLREGITFWDSAPQSLQQLTPYFNIKDKFDVHNSLRLVFLSGDWIPLSLPGTVSSIFSSAKVVGLGGATEATVWSNYFIIDGINPVWKSIPYGKPIQNAMYYILDNKMTHCRIQQPGDLYIGGDCLALGYYNDPVLTDSKFIPDPYNPGSKLYFTGDKAQWMSDGNIEFLGREDDQIKIRGFRVEIGEIRNVVLQNKEIKDAIVIPDKSDRHNIKAILFITTYDDKKLEVKDLKREFRGCLPEYMIPADIIQCTEFSTTANGKIDTKRLLSDYLKSLNDHQTRDFVGLSGEDILTFTPVEKKIYKIWSEALKTKAISVTDNFFDVGGNSLLAISLINKIGEELGLALTFRELISNPTITQIGTLVENRTKGSEKAVELVHLSEMDNLPLTRNQKRLWLFSKLQPDIASYIIGFTYRFHGSLNLDLFQKSLDILFHRHHILFSVIKEVEGEPYCDINPHQINISFIDYSALPENERKEKSENLISEDSWKVFDLEHGPLYRLYLIRTGREEYYFRISIHHIIFDGWSWSVLAKDLNEIYNTLSRGEELNLKDIDFQQYDYAQWEKSSAASENENKAIEFWKENLDGSSPILNFPYDYPRREQPSGRGSYEIFHLSKELTERLRSISKSEGSSLFTAMLSVFGIEMHKYSGEDDINIGLPVAYRPHSKLENIIGMFVNTVVVRLQYSKELTFRDILHQTNNATLNAIAHQDLTFDNIVEIVNPERSSNANPLFQVGFAWQNNLDMPISLNDIRCERIKGKERPSIFDITLSIWENGSQIEGEIEYNLDLLERDTIVRLKNNLITLLESIISNPDQAISEISIVSDTDKRALDEFNNTDVVVPEILVQEFFELKVKQYPENTAVISEGKSLTYSELNTQSNQLARHLISLRVTPGTVVGVCLERSVDMVVSALGVFKAGCCYLPLDPSFPDERISYMYEDSGADVLISQSSLKDRLHQFSDNRIVLTDTIKEKLSSYSTDNPSLNPNPELLAYIIYTSGSTGKPKGVKVHHQAVVNWIQSMSKIPGANERDTLLALSTPSFDMSVTELFLTLSNGATLILPNRQDVKDGTVLINLIEKHDVTIIVSTPSFWSVLIDNGWEGKNNLKGVCGGEALTLPLLFKLLPKVKELWNYYGPTETTMCSTGTRITDPFSRILIGKPMDNTKVYILDKYNHLLPVGVIGELAIGGLGVSKGYINRPDLTAEKFILFENNQVIYKTGDQGRILKDGNIELFGRIDNQVKIRGYRIELGEIESLLLQLSKVKEVVVKVSKFDENDERLVAFLNVDEEFTMSNDDIKDFLGRTLPTYMIPTFYQRSDGFPRLPNGKINKKALLLEIDESDKRTEIDFDSLTSTQKKLISIWEDVLKIKNIIPTESFFDIGGNSLLAIRILNKIKEELGFKFSFKAFISHPTIINSGNLIDSQITSENKIIELKHLARTTNLPLTKNQKRLWIISKLLPDIPSYIIPVNYKLFGSLNRDIFQKSFEILFKRHHIVFSVIKEIDGEPYCDIIPSKVEMSFIDDSALTEKEISEKVNDLIHEDSRKVFDLEQGPLYRLYLIMTGRNEYYFRISIHHIVFDGWSWSVLVKDLNEIYRSLLRGEELNLKEIEFQQYDFAEWEKSSAGSKNEDELKEFWKENLNGASPILNFPFDYQRSEQPSGRGSYVTIELSMELTDRLRRISKSEGSSLFTTMLSVFGIQMQNYSGKDDINLGMPVAYRPHSSLENIFGMFVNTIVVRLRYAKKNTFREIIHITSEAALNAIAHQDLPFEKVVEIVNPERSFNANPLFQVSFIWQNNLDMPIILEGIRSEKMAIKERTSIFDLSMCLWENEEIIQGEIDYSEDLLNHDTVIRLRDNFIYLLETLSENPDQTLSDISIISESDKTKLAGFNNTEVAIPDILIQNFFEKQVKLAPLRTAVISQGRNVTYRELDNQSNQIANYLIGLGVIPGDFVGVCIERSIDMVVSVLGVIKAGCCYLPMDPSFPDDRISFMYEDSGARVLISQNSLKYKFHQFSNVPIVLTDSDKSRISRYSTEKPELKINPQSLAYIIYTSGSTGKPKGVKVQHQAVVNFINSMSKRPGFSEGDRLLAVTTLSFDISVLELFLPLSFGAKLIIAESDDIFDGQKLSGLLEQFDITVMQATPATWNILLGSGWQGKKNLKALCGGEAIQPGLVKDLLPKVESLWNMYGPTETTVWSTCQQLTDAGPPIMIGTPIDNTMIYILDKNNNHLPVGVIGEVCIGGLGVTKGYHDRPELTAEKFIPFENGQIIYKTGDLGRFLINGNIELFGRIDNQIKLRGFRIEPGEIESLLSRLSGVREAVVKIHRFGDNDERLIAFLNVDVAFKMTNEELKSSLVKHLPLYMIPSFFQTSDDFPRLPNGKINKKALIFEFTEHSVKENKDIRTLKPTEKIVFDIWSDILKTRNISISDNFFEIGGNSLLAISVFSKIESAFNIKIRLRVFFDSPRIKDLAENVDIAINKVAGRISPGKMDKKGFKIIEGEI